MIENEDELTRKIINDGRDLLINSVRKNDFDSFNTICNNLKKELSPEQFAQTFFLAKPEQHCRWTKGNVPYLLSQVCSESKDDKFIEKILEEIKLFPIEIQSKIFTQTFSTGIDSNANPLMLAIKKGLCGTAIINIINIISKLDIESRIAIYKQKSYFPKKTILEKSLINIKNNTSVVKLILNNIKDFEDKGLLDFFCNSSLSLLEKQHDDIKYLTLEITKKLPVKDRCLLLGRPGMLNLRPQNGKKDYIKELPNLISSLLPDQREEVLKPSLLTNVINSHHKNLLPGVIGNIISLGPKKSSSILFEASKDKESMDSILVELYRRHYESGGTLKEEDFKDFIQGVFTYRKTRGKRPENCLYSYRFCLSFFSNQESYTSHVKDSALSKLVFQLIGQETEDFTGNEIKALNDGLLYKTLNNTFDRNKIFQKITTGRDKIYQEIIMKPHNAYQPSQDLSIN